MQTLPEPQASSMAEPHGPVAYPYLDALHQEFPVSPAQQPTSNDQTATKTKPQLAQHGIHKRHVYASPTSTASEPSAPHLSQDTQARPPRRRENRYRNAPPSVQSRRRAQNRASQRAYRERKEQRIRDLEHLLQEAHRREETLTQAYLSLRTEYERLSGEQEDRSSMGTPTPVTGETMPARLRAASVQHCSDVAGGFDFSPNAYEYADDTQQ
ncbi:Basic-leucine zipper (bZIP) transcription factor [Metarhizium robertsii ARSEF 23]|nr:Basic-leucine zipper (bZIP) transcription factor [Metarhizium robertsii ARSEF 23]EFZ01609.1 Basic-leucine zipper (bZIP) transcription factor [Metarhizium robertsii ARSEF 23]